MGVQGIYMSDKLSGVLTLWGVDRRHDVAWLLATGLGGRSGRSLVEPPQSLVLICTFRTQVSLIRGTEDAELALTFDRVRGSRGVLVLCLLLAKHPGKSLLHFGLCKI